MQLGVWGLDDGVVDSFASRLRVAQNLGGISHYIVQYNPILDIPQPFQILDHCDLIERPQSSEAIAYIKKSLRDLAKKQQQQKEQEPLPGQPVGAPGAGDSLPTTVGALIIF